MHSCTFRFQSQFQKLKRDIFRRRFPNMHYFHTISSQSSKSVLISQLVTNDRCTSIGDFYRVKSDFRNRKMPPFEPTSETQLLKSGPKKIYDKAFLKNEEIRNAKPTILRSFEDYFEFETPLIWFNIIILGIHNIVGFSLFPFVLFNASWKTLLFSKYDLYLSIIFGPMKNFHTLKSIDFNV